MIFRHQQSVHYQMAIVRFLAARSHVNKERCQAPANESSRCPRLQLPCSTRPPMSCENVSNHSVFSSSTSNLLLGRRTHSYHHQPYCDKHLHLSFHSVCGIAKFLFCFPVVILKQLTVSCAVKILTEWRCQKLPAKMPLSRKLLTWTEFEDRKHKLVKAAEMATRVTSCSTSSASPAARIHAKFCIV